MSTGDIRNFLDSLASHITFVYRGRECGVDPLAHDHFDMWFGDDVTTAKSLDEVMESPFFDGKALSSIVDEIQNIEM